MFLIRVLCKPNFFVFALLFNAYLFNKPLVDGGRVYRARRSEPKPSTNSTAISLGFIFGQHSAQTSEVFKTIMQVKSQMLKETFDDVNLLVNVINTVDVFKLTRIICTQLSRGVVSIMGNIPLESFPTFESYVNIFTIPFLAPATSLYLRSLEGSELTLSLKPDYHEAIIDLINYYDWPQIIYLYDSEEGLRRFEKILHAKIPKKEQFTIDYAYRVYNVNDVIQYLIKIEEHNQWSTKYVVLDSGAELARETLKKHANEVKLGKRNYHYLLTGLVLDDIEDPAIKEYGAINVTGFALLDKTNKRVHELLNVLRQETISAEAALLHDAFSVMVDAIQRITSKVPTFIDDSSYRTVGKSTSTMDCYRKTGITPFDIGKELAKSMKQTELEGLTGFVGFNDEGRRRNYDLQVMEMNQNGKLDKIGTWHQDKGLTLLNGKTSPEKKFKEFDRSKTYIITTIIENPFLVTEKNEDHPEAERLAGFCYDLANLLMDKLDAKFEMRIVKDGNYGNRNAKSISGWDGMIGEILRHEADMAVAALIQTPDRKAVVDFSQPFLSFTKKTDALIETPVSLRVAFTLLLPFTTELWVALLFCIFLFSAFRCFVSYGLNRQYDRMQRRSRANRRARRRRRSSTPSPIDSPERNAAHDDSARALLRRFGDAVWDTIRTFLQQGSGERPGSVAEKILVGIWLFFTLLIFAFYTASLSSYLAVNRIDESVQSLIKIFTCPQDNYRDSVEGTVIPWTITNVFKHESTCELIISSSLNGTEYIGIVLPKGSQLREGINHVLDYLKKEGEVERLIRKWFLHGKVTSQIQYKVQPFTLKEASGMFFILFVSLLLAVLVAMATCYRYKNAHRNVERREPISNELEEVNPERIDPVPPPHEVEMHEEQVDLERIEVYGVPTNSNERPYPAYYRQNVSPLSIHQEAAHVLNRAVSDAGPLNIHRGRRHSNSYDLHEL